MRKPSSKKLPREGSDLGTTTWEVHMRTAAPKLLTTKVNHQRHSHHQSYQGKTQSKLPLQREGEAKITRMGQHSLSEKERVYSNQEKCNTLTVRGHNNRAMAAPTNTVRREAYRQRCPCATGPVVAGDYNTGDAVSA